jgi:hypothetical protein
MTKAGPAQKGFSNMLLRHEVTQKIESQETRPNFNGDAIGEALQIEEVLNRAYEIRRSRGGLFGYDLEDWLEAERELAESNRAGRFHVAETAHAESLPGDQERTTCQCSGLNH